MLLCDLTIREHAHRQDEPHRDLREHQRGALSRRASRAHVYAKLGRRRGRVWHPSGADPAGRQSRRGAGHAARGLRRPHDPGRARPSTSRTSAFERPGRYEFRLYADDRFVAGKSFTVIQSAAGARPQLMRVLILTASYGSGHNAAARSLADGLRRARRRPSRSSTTSASWCTRSSSAPAGALYMALLRRAPMRVGRRLRAGRLAAERLAAGLRDDAPRHRAGSPRCSTRWRPTPSSPCTPRRPRRCPRSPPRAGGCRRTRPS